MWFVVFTAYIFCLFSCSWFEFLSVLYLAEWGYFEMPADLGSLRRQTSVGQKLLDSYQLLLLTQTAL
jgi:hypothetical protein